MPSYVLNIIVQGKDLASSALTNVGKALSGLHGKFQEAANGINGASGTINRALGNMGQITGGILGAQVITGAINGLKSLTAEALDSYAAYERLGLSLQSMAAKEMVATGQASDLAAAMGPAAEKAKELQSWVQKLAIESPFTQDGVAQAYRMAMAYGFTTKEAQRLTTAMIDFASGTGASEDRMQMIALALGQIKAKGKLAGQEVLQLVNTGLAVDQILAKAFGKSTQEIVKMREQGLIPANEAIEAITKSLEQDFGGAAKRQATTFSGLLSSLQDIKSVGLREFFTGTFQAIQPYVADFVNKLSSPEFMQSLRDIGMQLGESLKKGIDTAKELAGWWNSLSDTTKNMIVGLGGVVLLAPGLINALTTVTGAVVSLGAAATTSTGAIGLLVTALAGVAVAYKANVVDPINNGVQAIKDSTAAHFAEMKASGATATAIGEEGARIRELVKEKDTFISKAWDMEQVQLLTVQAIKDSAGSYEDYKAAMNAFLKPQGQMINDLGQLVTLDGRLIETNYAVAESNWELFKSQGKVEAGQKAITAHAQLYAIPAMEDLKKATDDTTGATKNAARYTDQLAGLTQDQVMAQLALSSAFKTVNTDLAKYVNGLDNLKTIVGGSLGQAFDDFTEKHKELADRINEYEIKLHGLSQLKYLTPEQVEEMQTLRTKLSEAKSEAEQLEASFQRQAKMMMWNLIMQQLGDLSKMTDEERAKVVQSMTKIAESWGLVDEKTAAVTQAISENIENIKMGKLDELIAKLLQIMGLPDTKTISVEITEYYRKVQEQQRRGKGGETEYASGGPVFEGVPSLAGEYAFTRPEYFIPATNGYMLTRQDAQEALAGKAGKGSTINLGGITINGSANAFTVRQAANNGILDAARAAGMR